MSIVPDWDPEMALKYLNDSDTDKAIWSITSPGPAIAGIEGSAQVAKDCNVEIANICKKAGERFQFWGNLPSLCNVQATLKEIDHCLTLDPKPLGFVVMTSYSDRLIFFFIF